MHCDGLYDPRGPCQLHWLTREAALQIMAAGLRYVTHDPNYQVDMDEDGGSDEEEEEDYAE